MPVITISAVNTTTDTLTTATPHGLLTGDRTRVRNVGGALPAGLTGATDLFAIRVDATNLKIATTNPNALAGTAINITTVGSGTNTLEYGLPYCVPEVLAQGSQVRSANLNGDWQAMVALYGMLTGQAQSVFSEVTLAQLLTANAGLTLAGQLRITGSITPPALVGGSPQNNYNPTGLANASIIYQSVTASNVGLITGLSGGVDGRVIFLFCTTAPGGSLILENQSSNSLAANRFALPRAVGFTLGLEEGGGCMLIYDGTAQRWRIATAALSGAGG